MGIVDDVARAQIAAHISQCSERHIDIRHRLSRIEIALISGLGSAIVLLLALVFKVV